MIAFSLRRRRDEVGEGGVRLNPAAPEKHPQEVVIASSMRGTIGGQLLPTTVRDGIVIRVELQIDTIPKSV